MAQINFTALARQRDDMRLTNKQIADLKGLSESTVSRILRGETKDPSFEAVAAICDVLNVSLDTLVGKGLEDVVIAEESVSGMTSAIRLMRDHIARIVAHVRSVEHEKDISFMRTIELLREQLTFRTRLFTGSVVLNVLLFIALMALLIYDILHPAMGLFH